MVLHNQSEQVIIGVAVIGTAFGSIFLVACMIYCTKRVRHRIKTGGSLPVFVIPFRQQSEIRGYGLGLETLTPEAYGHHQTSDGSGKMSWYGSSKKTKQNIELKRYVKFDNEFDDEPRVICEQEQEGSAEDRRSEPPTDLTAYSEKKGSEPEPPTDSAPSSAAQNYSSSKHSTQTNIMISSSSNNGYTTDEDPTPVDTPRPVAATSSTTTTTSMIVDNNNCDDSDGVSNRSIRQPPPPTPPRAIVLPSDEIALGLERRMQKRKEAEATWLFAAATNNHRSVSTQDLHQAGTECDNVTTIHGDCEESAAVGGEDGDGSIATAAGGNNNNNPEQSSLAAAASSNRLQLQLPPIKTHHKMTREIAEAIARDRVAETSVMFAGDDGGGVMMDEVDGDHAALNHYPYNGSFTLERCKHDLKSKSKRDPNVSPSSSNSNSDNNNRSGSDNRDSASQQSSPGSLKVILKRRTAL